MLTVLPTPDIREYSTMTRDLCVQLTDIGEGLERSVMLDFSFVESGYSRNGMYLCMKIECQG